MCRTYQEGTFYISYLRFSTRILNEMCKKIFFKNQNMTEKIHKNFMMMTFVKKKKFFCWIFTSFFLVISVLGSLILFFLCWNRWAWEILRAKFFVFLLKIFSQNIYFSTDFMLNYFGILHVELGFLLFKFCLIMLEIAISFFMGYGVQMGLVCWP